MSTAHELQARWEQAMAATQALTRQGFISEAQARQEHQQLLAEYRDLIMREASPPPTPRLSPEIEALVAVTCDLRVEYSNGGIQQPSHWNLTLAVDQGLFITCHIGATASYGQWCDSVASMFRMRDVSRG